MSNRAKRKRRRVWPRVLLGLLIFLLVLVLATVAAVNLVLSKIGRPDPNETYLTPQELEEIDLRAAVEENAEPGVVYPELDESQIQWSTPNQNLRASQDIVNILLIGQDRRPGEGRARSDSMILVSFNRSNDTITMVSFLRDLYVQIPGYDNNRLNAAYAFGGMDLLDRTLEENFGVRVDYNVEVDFTGFSSVIDALGGVDISLSPAEAEYMGLSTGWNHMDGDTALSYSRIRYLDSDFGRTGRQRNVLTSVYKSAKNMGFSNLISLVNDVFPLLTTDMSNLEIVALATELFPMLKNSSLESCHIPADGTYSFNTVRGMSVIVADFAANQDILAEALAPDSNN